MAGIEHDKIRPETFRQAADAAPEGLSATAQSVEVETNAGRLTFRPG